MTFWELASKHLTLLFAFNSCKTVLGAGFIGYGVTLLAISPDEGREDDDAKADGDSSSIKKTDNNGTSWFGILYNKYVRASATIGFGLFLAAPAIASQIALETMIPGFLITDIGYDVAAENVREMLPTWKKPKLVSKGKEFVGEIIREAEALTHYNDTDNK